MEEESITIQTARKEKLRVRLKEFLATIDVDLRYFCKEVRKDLRNERDYVIAITGYAGVGKSQLGSIIGLLIDFEYEFDFNICFIPSSKEIEQTYMKLPMYSILHIDEASRGLHKQKWYDKIQQKLNELYDTEREGHFLCTLLLMPRFQNFAENFRNFRIKYWVNILDRGLAVIYKRDEDKDAKDPWHIDESYKLKLKSWRNKKIYERDLPSVIRMEQKTPNYWFYFKVPQMPEDIWEEYQVLKKNSRNIPDADFRVEDYRDKVQREKMDKWIKIKEMKSKGIRNTDIAAVLGCSSETVSRHLKSMEGYERMKGDLKIPLPDLPDITNNIYNHIEKDKNKKIPDEFDKIVEK